MGSPMFLPANGAGLGLPGGGANQWGPLPPANPPFGGGARRLNAYDTGAQPGVVQPAVPTGVTPTAGAGGIAGISIPGKAPTTAIQSGPGQIILPISPGFTQQFGQWLASQMGQGATPFDLSALLPTGGQTAPGQLSAPMNAILSNLYNFLQTGNAGGAPGLGTLEQMSQTGMPIDQTPAWQAMVQSMQRQIGQGAEQEREQFAFGGNLASSPFGQAMTDYYSQTSKDLNAQLLQAQTQALEAARQRQMGATGTLTNLQEQLGQVFQGLDQASIDRLLQEFIRTRPEYSPLLNMMYGFSTTFPPYAGKSYGISGLASALGGAGSLMSGAGSLIQALGLGGASGAAAGAGAGAGLATLPLDAGAAASAGGDIAALLAAAGL